MISNIWLKNLQKGAYPYEYMNSFKRFSEEKLLAKKCFSRSFKNGVTGDDSKKLDSHISHEEFLTCKKNVDGFDVMPISKENKTGFIFEVDLEHPDELHESHNDYPLAPKKLAISYEMLWDYCKELHTNMG